MPKLVGNPLSSLGAARYEEDNAGIIPGFRRVSFSQARAIRERFPRAEIVGSLDTTDRGSRGSFAKRWYRWFVRAEDFFHWRKGRWSADPGRAHRFALAENLDRAFGEADTYNRAVNRALLAAAEALREHQDAEDRLGERIWETLAIAVSYGAQAEGLQRMLGCGLIETLADRQHSWRPPSADSPRRSTTGGLRLSSGIDYLTVSRGRGGRARRWKEEEYVLTPAGMEWVKVFADEDDGGLIGWRSLEYARAFAAQFLPPFGQGSPEYAAAVLDRLRPEIEAGLLEAWR